MNALELADHLQMYWHEGDPEYKAAAELRRLHEQNAALVAALRLIATSVPSSGDLAYCKGVARAALAKIGETK